MQKRAIVLLILTTVLFSWFITPLGAEPLFGPKTYTKGRGRQATYTEQVIQCEPKASYRLVVVNGNPDGSGRLANATIWVNGEEVLHPREIGRRIGKVEKVITLQTENRLQVRLGGGKDRRRGQDSDEADEAERESERDLKAKRPKRAERRLTVSIECVANCFAVRMQRPLDAGILNRAETMVRGTVFSSAEEVGVQVNGVIAEVSGSMFVAASVPLAVGENAVTATAANACGSRATDSVVVSVENPDPAPLRLIAAPAAGVVPLRVRLKVLSPVQATNVEWDFDGNGVMDASGPTLLEVERNYAQEGIYFPTVILTDAAGNRQEAVAVVNALSFEKMDMLLNRKWEGMKGALRGGEIERALGPLTAGAKPKYRQLFERFGDRLPEVAANLPSLRFIRLEGEVAAYYVLKMEAGVEKAHFVYFIRDADGFWRLAEF